MTVPQSVSLKGFLVAKRYFLPGVTERSIFESLGVYIAYLGFERINPAVALLHGRSVPRRVTADSHQIPRQLRLNLTFSDSSSLVASDRTRRRI